MKEQTERYIGHEMHTWGEENRDKIEEGQKEEVKRFQEE